MVLTKGYYQQIESKIITIKRQRVIFCGTCGRATGDKISIGKVRATSREPQKNRFNRPRAYQKKLGNFSSCSAITRGGDKEGSVVA